MPTPPRNKKWSTIHLPDKAGFLPRRSKFLDGTLKAYYGPGQSPRMLGSYGLILNPDESVIWPDVIAGPTSNPDTYYTNPTGWPAANRLLRMPQVVWLENKIVSMFYAPTDPNIIQWIDGDGNGQWETVTHVTLAEALRLSPIFAAVKTTIESLRPGRTWVRVVDWCIQGSVSSGPFSGLDGAPSVTTWVGRTDEGGYSTTDVQGQGGCFATGPSAAAGSYLGTDWFHVYVGDALIDNQFLDNQLGTADFNFNAGGSIEGHTLAEDPTGLWTAAYNRLKAYARYAYGASVRLYHPPAGWVDWVHSWDDTLGPIDSETINNGSMAIYRATAGHFDEAATIAAGDQVDLTHVGASTLITGAAYLVNLIADHFHFDPATGADLPG
jgi:hypothetical protein